MQDDRDYSVYPSDLNALGAFTKFYEYLKSNGYTAIEKIQDGLSLELTVNAHRILHAENYDEFLRLLAEYPTSMPIYAHNRFEKGKDMGFACIIGMNSSGLETSVRCDNLDVVSSVHDHIREYFRACNPGEDRMNQFVRRGLKKSVFLAHRFDELGTSTAAIVSEFVRALRFDLKEGAGYESRDIPDKVAARIRSQDILIAVVTPGDASWILTELAYSKALGKYTIIIIEHGCELNKGIIGSDFEHMEFPPGRVEKCFLPLVSALPL